MLAQSYFVSVPLFPISPCRQRQDDCRKCHALLHDKGAAHYAAHNYAPAADLLTPAVFFATSLTAGKSARLLAMALLKSHQPGRAADYVGLAEQQEGSVTTTGCIIRLQAALRLQAQACNRGSALPAALAAEQGPVLATVRALGTVSELPSEAFQVSSFIHCCRVLGSEDAAAGCDSIAGPSKLGCVLPTRTAHVV